MNLPNVSKSKENFSSKLLPFLADNQSGQILVIFLLILVVGLAVTLSIASRTVTDIRQTSTSDESNKAYFAAEAGIESALKRIAGGSGATTFSVSFSNVNNSACSGSSNCSTSAVTIANLVATGTQVYQIPDNVARDDVAQISLIGTFNDLSTVGNSAVSLIRTDGLRIYFGDGADPNDAAHQYAIEVSVVSYCSSGCLPSGQWFINKYAFDAQSTRGNGFCTVETGPYNGLVGEINTANYHYKVDITAFNNNLTSSPNYCATVKPADLMPANYNPVLVRIRPLYNSSPIPIAVQGCTTTCTNPPNKQLPTQGQKVTSVGTTPSGVTRNLLVYRSYPALPALFDYVLFNGSSTTPLTK